MSYKERFEPLQYYIGGAWTSELPETVSLTSSAGFSIEQ
jgi:hypothetical protein